MVIVCSACNSKIPVGENYSRFFCPNCLEVEIVRCKVCKSRVSSYKCPKCGFEGP